MEFCLEELEKNNLLLVQIDYYKNNIDKLKDIILLHKPLNSLILDRLNKIPSFELYSFIKEVNN
jgi:hypothetical protein